MAVQLVRRATAALEAAGVRDADVQPEDALRLPSLQQQLPMEVRAESGRRGRCTNG